jgi:hypothetical protein
VPDVESFVALESDQVGFEGGGHGSGERGLSHAGLSLEKQRALQPQGEKQRDRKAAIGYVMMPRKTVLQFRD